MSSARVLGVTLAVAIGLTAAGCAANGSAAHGRVSGPGKANQGVTTGLPAARDLGLVGAGCDRIPATGPGNITDLAAAPVVTAVAHFGLLTEIALAIKAAGLTSSLNAAKAITVFAPDDSAFAALGPGNLSTLLADKSDLIKIVKYHVVAGRKTPADLASGRRLTTLLGTVIVPATSHGKYRVNNAQVVCGAIQTANATVYIVNKVLVPIP
jgi:uncharacterized surface protein with fasciclin (FAS1) repeats